MDILQLAKGGPAVRASEPSAVAAALASLARDDQGSAAHKNKLGAYRDVLASAAMTAIAELGKLGGQDAVQKAAAELTAFPLLGAGTARISETPELATVSILELQSLLFASVCGCVVLVLRIIQELWQPTGGVFNVDDVLQQMIFGLELELDDRLGEVRRMSAAPPPGDLGGR